MNKSLYIIGNGFDRAHSMPVCYSCFKHYLEKDNGKKNECVNCIYHTKEFCKRKECYLLSLLNTAISDKENWSDFEEALAKMDFRCLNISSFQTFDNLIDNFGECMQEAFHSWVDNIVIPPCECRLFNLETPAFYLTFNYTMVLEGMYKISPENVYHVHSSYIEKQDTGRKYVFGHSSLDTDIQKYMQKQIHDVRESIIDDWSIALGCLRKESLSESHPLYNVLRRANLETPAIKIIGHSFGKVDFDYFDVIRGLFPQAKWIYYYHSNDALCGAQNNINIFMREKGIIDVTYEPLSNISIKK